MTVYRSDILYRGNLIKQVDGKKTVENMDLLYDEKTDTFYDYVSILNDELDLAFTSLSIEKQEEIRNKINKYRYPYSPSNLNISEYIDENSITSPYKTR